MKLRVLGMVCAAACTMNVSADYLTAVNAYNNKDFAKAKSEFLLAAELGDSKAQRVLSTMYAKGEGGPLNAVDAYAWAAVAAIEDKDVAAKIRDAIGAQLPPTIKTQADKRATELTALYSREAVEARLGPVLNSNEPTVYDLQFPEAMLKTGLPVEYPKRAMDKEEQGIVCVSFYLNAEGQPVAPLAFAPWDKKPLLKSSTEKQLEGWRFQNGKANTRYAYCLDFLIEDDGTYADAATTEKALQKASGNRSAMVLLARELSAASVASSNRVDPRYATQAWREAALLGDAEAAYELASRLLRGDGCRRDRVKALRWMDYAARTGSSFAKGWLALYLEPADEIKLDNGKKTEYLREAASSGHPHAQLAMAIQQLKSKDPAAHSVAVSTLRGLDQSLSIAVWDWLAYGLGLLGEFDDAEDVAEDALDFARSQNLDTTQRQQAYTMLSEGKLGSAPK